MRRVTAAITGVHGYVPEQTLSNKDLEKLVETSDDWIVTRTGISERRILTEKGVGTSFMGIRAAQGLLKKTNTSPLTLDAVLVATVTPDYVHYPASSNIISKAIGATNAFAFDLQAGCSSFLFSLTTAARYIESGLYQKILVIGMDKMSSLVDYQDRSTCVLFGDGAAAVLLEADEEGYGLKDAILRSDGSGVDFLKVPAGGSLRPASAETISRKEHFMHQEGGSVYKFAVSKMADVARQAMERNGLSREDVDWVIPHQANKRIIEAAVARLGVPEEKVMYTIHKYGNTSNASMPLCLWEYEPLLRRGDNLLLVAFGGGFAWGSVYLKWAYDGAAQAARQDQAAIRHPLTNLHLHQ
jgi:3-oxoacyl-[acyl-carrier-protein] synthase-3